MIWFTMLMKYLADIGFSTGPELVKSMAPSLKIGGTFLVVCLSSIISMVEIVFGLNGVTIIAFAVLLTLELVTGIQAARKRGEAIQSKRMGRFTFKLIVFLALMFVLNAFAEQFSEKNEMAQLAFRWVQTMGFAWFALENLISVYENYAVITGKDTSNIISALRRKLDKILGKDE
jgi:hypothetical protein